MFIPKKTKYKKYQKQIKINTITKSINFKTFVAKGYSVIALKSKTLTSNIINMAKMNLKKQLKKSALINISIFAHHPVSKKPNENRMGKGKGSINHWIAKIRPGTKLFRFHTLAKSKVEKALKKLQYKFPVKLKYVKD